MLNDSQMSKLAETLGECKFHNFGSRDKNTKRESKVFLDEQLIAHAEREEDYQLTLAGYFVVIEKLRIQPVPFGKDKWIVAGVERFDTLPAAIDAALSEILK